MAEPAKPKPSSNRWIIAIVVLLLVVIAIIVVASQAPFAFPRLG
jgi:hypothetical protein